jgi:hypothetical protein
MAGVFGALVRPEIGDDLVATQSARSVGREQREQREAAALLAARPEGRPGDRKASKRLKSQRQACMRM